MASSLKVGIVGAGSVGSALGGSLLKKGTQVKYGVRNVDKYKPLLESQPGVTLDSIESTILWADAVILATSMPHDDAGIKGVVTPLKDYLKGKVLLDTGNPLSPYPGLEVRLGKEKSGGELIAEALPETHVFKAFNTIGAEHMKAADASNISGQALTMLFAGPKEGLDIAEQVISATGFIPKYVGPIRYSRNLEAIAELWIHLGVPGVGTAENWGRNFHFQVISDK